ncbi:MAG: DUF3040 domain-containing protein [Micromonosporaceae bacterium]|nr:DUF3040 domain-containing protein [Micromonosporaceae bacterium]
MPLSEHEQRLFDEIERSLADDPKFASAVRANDPRSRVRRRLAVAALLVLVGLGVVVYGAVSKTQWIGVIGFVVMLGAAVFGMQSYRRAQSAGPELRAVGGAATTRRTRSRKSSLIDRLEARWRRRPEGDR